MSSIINPTVEHNERRAEDTTVSTLGKVSSLQNALVNKRTALYNQVSCQNQIKMKAYCVSFRAKINDVAEGENPTNILGLPNEAWENIFSNLDDFTDFKSCFNTCQQFRSSLGVSQKALIQLKKVLPILLPLGYLSIKSILDLRLLSKDVCMFVDKYLQSKQSWNSISNVAPIQYALIPNIYDYTEFNLKLKVASDSKARAIIRKPILTGLNTTNPFLSRSLAIYNGTHCHHIILNFLGDWGSQIWYLNLVVECTKVEFLEILRMLPNLKYLKVSGKIIEDEEVFQGNYSKLLKEACPKLTSLGISVLKRDIASVFENLYDALSAQLQELRVNSCYNAYLNSFRFPNSCEMIFTNSDYQREMSSHLSCLRATNLRRLSVILIDQNDCNDFKLVLRVVKKLEHLEELKIYASDSILELSDDEIFMDVNSEDINTLASKLKRIYIEYSVIEKIPVSILANFPNLEYLQFDERLYMDVYKNVDYEKGRNDLGEVTQYFKNKMESVLGKLNLWKVLPFLKEIRLRRLTWLGPLGDRFQGQTFTKPIYVE